MWIVTNKGFMSIVAKDRSGKPTGPRHDAEVSVRFRRPEDAARLFPDHEVVMTPRGDYACRVFATREEVAGLLVRAVLKLDYTNFKSSIPVGDRDLDRAAHAAWSVFGKLQKGGPYGRSQPKAGGDLFDEIFDETGPASSKKYRDPFCDGCGMRVGAKNLDHGLCPDCAERAANDPALKMEPASAGRCWNCDRDVDERSRFKLCADCAPAFAGEDDDMLENLSRAIG